MRSLHTTTKGSPHLPQLEKARAQRRRPNAAKNKINKYINKYIKKKKEWRSETNKGRQSIKGTLSSQLPLWVNGADLAGETMGASVKLSPSQVPHPRGDRAGVLIFQLLSGPLLYGRV